MRAVEFVKNNYILVALLLVGAVLRFYRLDFQSVWLDEIHTLNDANPANSFAEVHASIIAADPHPPLYFYIIQLLLKIFGYTPVVARMFSVIIGIYTIYALYRLGSEMYNGKVGLIAALMLCANSYHIYYSQEARPYAMLCLFTILSFLYLVRYIKMPSRKNAVYYGIFTALMLYGHFFSIFALLSQMAILLFFAVVLKKENRKLFIINASLAGAIAFVLFLPSVKVFMAAMQIKSFWIPYPTPDSYTLILKEFFGSSEMLLFVFGFMATLYFVKLSKQKNEATTYDAVVGNNTIFGFIILAAWIVTVALLPMIRSYTAVPMLISRYFINTLPAILILIAAGLYQFKNRLVFAVLAVLLFVFSLTDLIVVKKYYKTVTKTQFREITQFIAANNTEHEPIVTSLGWYFPYFLNNEVNKFDIISKSLDEYIHEMILDPSKAKAFWYVDAHNRPYNVTAQTQQFLDSHFIVENNAELYDIWTKHFVLLKDISKTIDISKYKELKPSNGDNLMYALENYSQTGNALNASGWAYFPEQQASGTSIVLVLVKDSKAVKLQTQKVARPDVTSYFKSNFNIDNSGFSVAADLSTLESGKYQLAVYAIDQITKKEALNLTDKFIEK